MILESLVDSLQEDTLPNITTKILAKKSDITEAAIYKHYKGKKEIFQELFKFIESAVVDKIYEIRNNQYLIWKKQKHYITLWCYL